MSYVHHIFNFFSPIINYAILFHHFIIIIITLIKSYYSCYWHNSGEWKGA